MEKWTVGMAQNSGRWGGGVYECGDEPWEFNTKRGISYLAEERIRFQEGPCSMELVKSVR